MSVKALERLAFPQQLPELRRMLQAAVRAGRSVEPMFAYLARHQPLALADVLVGPRATEDAAMVRAALQVVDTLEALVQPQALYRRLLRLALEARTSVLLTAAERHWDAPWILPMSFQVEGEQAGYLHLCAAPLRGLEALCARYAAEGAVGGMAAAGAARGSDLPARALLRAGDVSGASRAATALLEVAPGAPVVEVLAAIWGPDLPPLLLGLVAEARTHAVLERLADYTRWYPALDIRRRQRAVELS